MVAYRFIFSQGGALQNLFFFGGVLVEFFFLKFDHSPPQIITGPSLSRHVHVLVYDNIIFNESVPSYNFHEYRSYFLTQNMDAELL